MLDAYDSRNTVRWGPDIFGRGAPDTEWIPQAASLKPKPVIVSGDGRILKRPAERQKLKAGKLTFVHLASGWTNTEWSVYAWKIVKVWPEILSATRLAREPTILEVAINANKVRRVCLTDNL